MLIEELLKTCADPFVAQGAVRSLGGIFAAEIDRLACEKGQSAGEYTADAVREFRAAATEADWHELATATQGKDMPILHGLKHILERSIAESIYRPLIPLASYGAEECCGAA